MILDWLYEALVTQRTTRHPRRELLGIVAAIAAGVWLGTRFGALFGDPMPYGEALLFAVPGVVLGYAIRWVVKTRVEDPTRIRREGVDR